MSTNRNTFSEASSAYASARPRYPKDLFHWVAAQCASRGRAWDCATGSGQAAVGLAAFFEQVTATDVSAEQLAHAEPHPRVQYAVASAEASGHADRKFELVTVAQALHWFKYDQFWNEVRRVTKPGSLFCAWGYDWLESTEAIDTELVAPFRAIIEPFWAPNNRILWEGYKPDMVQFPFERIAVPSFAIQVEWTLDHLLEYMMTWSAFKHSRADQGAVRAMDALLSRARARLPGGEHMSFRMPLKSIAGRII